MTRDLAQELADLVEARRSAKSGTIPFRKPSIEATPYLRRDPASFPTREKMEERDPTYRAIRQFARDLGSVEEMVRVYDDAAERFGHHTIQGVNSIWNGIYGWMA